MPNVIEDGKVKVATDVKDVSGTTPVTLYTCMPPTVKYVVKKLIIYNKDTADHEVTVGAYNTTGAAWSKDKLVVKVLAGQMITLTEQNLPADFVMTVDPSTAILAWAAKLEAAVSANPVKVKAEFQLM